MTQRPALIIFARAPIAGHSKTRLIPALGATGAAELYRCFLLDTFAQASHVPASITVAAAEPQDSAPLRALVQDVCPQARLVIQSGSDLGERMANCMEQALQAGSCPVVLVGSDAPTLPVERLQQALALLAERDVILGPCLDGGYYLIGLRRPVHGIFEGIAWSSETVLLDTLRRAQQAQASVALLEPWYDVDTPEDLALLRTHLSALSLAGEAIPCPRTWEFLQALQAGDER